MGMPTYGQSFTLEDPNSNGLNAKSKGPGEAGEFTRQGGFLSFYEVWLINKVQHCNLLHGICFRNV